MSEPNFTQFHQKGAKTKSKQEKIRLPPNMVGCCLFEFISSILFTQKQQDTTKPYHYSTVLSQNDCL